MRVGGRVEPGFEPVQEAFAEVLAAHGGPGVGLAAWSDGVWVVDLWGDAAADDVTSVRRRPFGPDSLVMPYTVSKPFAAVALAAARGPRSGRPGRAEATVLAAASGPGDGPPGALPPGRTGGAGPVGADGGALRLGRAVRPARRAGPVLAAGHPARRVGAVLRPPARRGRPTSGRAPSRDVPARGGLRPTRAGLPRGADRGRAGQGRRPGRAGRAVPAGQPGRAGRAVPQGHRQPARRTGPGGGQRLGLAGRRGARGQRPRHRPRGGRPVRRPARRRCSARACWPRQPPLSATAWTRCSAR